MFSHALLLATMAFSTLSAAQNYSAPGSGNLTIDLTQIPDSELGEWCSSEKRICPLICGGDTSNNSCTAPNVLDYQCVCSDNSSPNISDYVGTIPTFICEQWKANCQASTTQNLTAQEECLAVTCGQEDARVNFNDTTTSATSATSSPTSSPTSNGGSTPTSSDSAPAQTTTGAANALLVGQSCGTGILATGLLGLFAFLL